MTASFRMALLLSAAVLPSPLIAQVEATALPAPSTGIAAPSAATPERSQLDVTVDVAGGYDDNIFVSRNGEKDDFLVIARPGLSLDRVWGDNRLTLRGQGEIGRYADFTTENYADWLAGIDGRLRVADDVNLLLGGEYQWEHESRASPDDVNGIEPTEYERSYAYGGLVYRGQHLSARLAGTLTRFNYRDVAAVGGMINNDDRDRTQFDVGARFGFTAPPGWDLFVQGAYDERDYGSPLDDFTFDRDSRGFGIVAGFRREFSRRLTAELFAGYLQHRWRDPRLTDIHTVDLGMVVDWNGAGGIGASFRLDRSVEETTFPGASAYVLTSGSLGLRASPHPRIQVGGGITGNHYDYRGVPRSEFILGAEIWTRYWLSRHFYMGLDYNLAQRSSNAAGFDFDQNRLMLRLGAQLRPHHAAGVAPLHLAAAVPGGGYAGLLIGHGTLTTGLDGPRGQGSNTADFGDMGFGYGAVLGYGVVAGSIYLGLEAEAFLDGPDWLHVAERRFSVDSKDRFGLAARLGYVTPARDLVYGRFGVAGSSLRTDYRRLDDQLFLDSDRRLGLAYGLGIEARAGRRGFVRAEYVMTSYDDYDVPTVGTDFDNFSNSEGQFRIGGGIRFGAAAADMAQIPPTRFDRPYIGLQVGHGALVSRNLGVREQSAQIDIQRSTLGPVLGGFVGYGLVFDRFYIGAEAEADISNIDWNIERDPTGRIYSAEHENSFGASARAGWLISDSALAYGRIGAVRTHFDIPFATTNQSVRSEQTQTGLRMGAGLEIGLGGRARLRLDYTVTDYSRYDVTYGENVDSFDHKESLVRVGFIWRL